MHLMAIFILETNNLTNNICLPKFVQTNNVSFSIKIAYLLFFFLVFMNATKCNLQNYTQRNHKAYLQLVFPQLQG